MYQRTIDLQIYLFLVRRKWIVPCEYVLLYYLVVVISLISFRLPKRFVKVVRYIQ